MEEIWLRIVFLCLGLATRFLFTTGVFEGTSLPRSADDKHHANLFYTRLPSVAPKVFPRPLARSFGRVVARGVAHILQVIVTCDSSRIVPPRLRDLLVTHG